MLSGPQQKFCEGIVKGLSASEAYANAYPKAAPKSAAANTTRLMKKDEVKAELERMRAKAEDKAGSAVLTLAEKRNFLARVIRTPIAEVSTESDLCQEWSETEGDKSSSRRLKMPSKLDAIKIDNDLSGDGAEAEGNKALAGLALLVAKLRK